jgi:putative membrane protein insertion efficiency factor
MPKTISPIALFALMILGGCSAVPWRPGLGEWSAAHDPVWGPRISEEDRLRLRRDTRQAVEGAIGGALEAAVRFYQSTLRKALASDCRFHPSCSNYMIESIRTEGPWLGVLLGIDRWMRDHPFKGRGYSDRIALRNSPKAPLRAYLYDPPGIRLREPVRWTPMQDRHPVPPGLAARAKAVRTKLGNATEEQRRLFSFAVGLLADDREELYRAGTEFRRFASYYPDSGLSSDARLLAAIASLLAGRDREAKATLDDLPGDPLALLARAYALFRLGEFTAALLDLDRLCTVDAGWRSEARCLKLLIELVVKDDVAAAETLSLIRADDPSDRWERVEQAIRARGDIPGRSPFLGGLFSALVPGAGQVYAGRPSDGLVSFFLTGLFAWASIESFDEEIDSAGVITGTIGLVFYLSGIAGGTRAAHAFNRSHEKEWFDRLASEARGPEIHWVLDGRDRRAWTGFAPGR